MIEQETSTLRWYRRKALIKQTLRFYWCPILLVAAGYVLILSSFPSYTMEYLVIGVALEMLACGVLTWQSTPKVRCEQQELSKKVVPDLFATAKGYAVKRTEGGKLIPKHRRTLKDIHGRVSLQILS